MNKKLMFSALMVCVCLFSACKKTEADGETEKQLHKVSFSVADFSQTVGAISKASSVGNSVLGTTDTLIKYTSDINYRIYNEAGVLINTKRQYSKDTNYGNITDELPTGNYKVFFSASVGDLIFSANSVPYSSATYSPINGFWYDTFVKQFDLNVGNTDIQSSIKLDRTIGAVEINLEDTIPYNTAKISVVFQNDGQNLSQKDNSVTAVSSTTRNFTLTASELLKKEHKFLLYVANISTTSDVVIKAYSSTGFLLREKTINNVRVYKNKKITLSGKLFDTLGNRNSSFTIDINKSWDAPPATINF